MLSKTGCTVSFWRPWSLPARQCDETRWEGRRAGIMAWPGRQMYELQAGSLYWVAEVQCFQLYWLNSKWGIFDFIFPWDTFQEKKMLKVFNSQYYSVAIFKEKILLIFIYVFITINRYIWRSPNHTPVCFSLDWTSSIFSNSNFQFSEPLPFCWPTIFMECSVQKRTRYPSWALHSAT